MIELLNNLGAADRHVFRGAVREAPWLGGHDREAGDEISQFAEIAGKRIALKRADRSGVEGDGRIAHPQEVPREHRKIARAIAQRDDGKRRVEEPAQVGAELTPRNHHGQGLHGGREQADAGCSGTQQIEQIALRSER